jgi:hypothetical protein
MSGPSATRQRTPSISDRARGCSRRIPIRPASESARCGTTSTFADPVRMKRPTARRVSMAASSEVKISGTRCTSSRMDFTGNRVRNPTGSALGAVRVASSSNETY